VIRDNDDDGDDIIQFPFGYQAQITSIVDSPLMIHY
jgi:hypothetical protein